MTTIVDAVQALALESAEQRADVLVHVGHGGVVGVPLVALHPVGDRRVGEGKAVRLQPHGDCSNLSDQRLRRIERAMARPGDRALVVQVVHAPRRRPRRVRIAEATIMKNGRDVFLYVSAAKLILEPARRSL